MRAGSLGDGLANSVPSEPAPVFWLATMVVKVFWGEGASNGAGLSQHKNLGALEPGDG